MADAAKKRPENVPGRYYVDQDCDACMVCINVAEDNFKMDENEEYAFVFKQPVNEEEEEACRQAIDSCPEEAIGEDEKARVPQKLPQSH